jgi:hypothetical protein
MFIDPQMWRFLAPAREASIRPKPDGSFEVVRLGHCRGPLFRGLPAAIDFARTTAYRVLVLNEYGKVVQDLRGDTVAV